MPNSLHHAILLCQHVFQGDRMECKHMESNSEAFVILQTDQ